MKMKRKKITQPLHENLHVISDICMTYFLIRTMTDSAQYLGCKLGGSRCPQSPTVNCLSEESDISYDISQLNIIIFSVLMANLN